MDHLQQTLYQCKKINRPALMTYITAGLPTPEETPDIMLAMEAGGAHVIELGHPFTDPIADGPDIQNAHRQALANGVTVSDTLHMVQIARERGLNIPVLFMSYYNPILQYGESRLLTDSKNTGVNGFLVVDLPVDEAGRFQHECVKAELSYIPTIAPSTSPIRMSSLCKNADSFIYCISRTGVTGAPGGFDTRLPDQIQRARVLSGGLSVLVGFGISSREHFRAVTSLADGAAVGSRVIRILDEAPSHRGAERVREYCRHITARNVDLGASGRAVSVGYGSGLPECGRALLLT